MSHIIYVYWQILKMIKVLIRLHLIFFSLIIVSCELNRTQTSVLTGALDRYQEKQYEKNAKGSMKCRKNIFDELICYKY